MAEIDLLRDFILAAGGGLGGGIGGGLIVLAGERLIAWRRRPVLVPSADTTRHRAVIIENVTTDRGPATYFRLHVQNDGRETARGCEVAIERLIRTEPTRIEYENDAIPLGWSLIPSNALHIHAHTGRFCDIFRVRAEDFAICSQMTPNYLANDLVKSCRDGARFELTLRISADNADPTRINIVCGWGHDLRNPFARNS